jgi:UDP-glucose 4-epimerase
MARYLVTGGAGFIGSHLVDALLENGHRVRVLDDLSSGRRGNLAAGIDELIEGDVADRRCIEAAFANIDGCFHLAAVASVEECNRNWLRTHQINLTGTINVLDQARRSWNGRPMPVVYASSAAVYGDCGATPVGESQLADPLSAYGADKRACELHARVAGAVHGVPTVGLRFFNMYGPRQDPRSPYSGVISIFADRLLRGEPVEIFGDGGQIRDFTYIADGVSALRRAMSAAATEAPVFNVCTGSGTTIKGLAETIAALCRSQLVVRQRPPRCGEIKISIGDPRRAAALLDFSARSTLADGISDTLAALSRGIKAEACAAA